MTDPAISQLFAAVSQLSAAVIQLFTADIQLFASISQLFAAVSQLFAAVSQLFAAVSQFFADFLWFGRTKKSPRKIKNVRPKFGQTQNASNLMLCFDYQRYQINLSITVLTKWNGF